MYIYNCYKNNRIKGNRVLNKINFCNMLIDLQKILIVKLVKKRILNLQAIIC